MRVLHVISALAPSGAEHQLRLLVRRLPHDCEVASLSRPDSVAATLRAAGTAVHELGTHADPATTGALRRLIRRGRFDLVHTHLYRGCVQGRFAARLAGVQHVVATAHQVNAHSIEGRATTAGVRALYLAAERAGQATIAVTPAVAGQLRAWGVPESRITVVPPAMDAAEFRFDPALRAAARARLEIPDGVPVVGGVGRLAHGAGFERLIRTLAEVPGAMLLLVGDGPARVALQRLAVIEGVAERVRFTGAADHLRELLCAMDVFAALGGPAPAEPEPGGWVVLEALAAGLPALYANCPPLDELAAARTTVDGAHRLSARDPESLSRALRTELLCHQERHGARLPARSAGARYDVAGLAAAVSEVYDRVAGR